MKLTYHMYHYKAVVHCKFCLNDLVVHGLLPFNPIASERPKLYGVLAILSAVGLSSLKSTN